MVKSTSTKSRLQQVRLLLHRLIPEKPRTHWFAVYIFLLLYFFFSRIGTVSSILDMYADRSERAAGFQLLGVILGSMEDFILITYLCFTLLIVKLITQWITRQVDKVSVSWFQCLFIWAGRLVHFSIVVILLFITIAPFAADACLIGSRQSRFKFDLIAMYFRDKANAGSFKIDPGEEAAVKRTIITTVIICIVYGILYVGWIDLTLWVMGCRKSIKSYSLVLPGESPKKKSQINWSNKTQINWLNRQPYKPIQCLTLPPLLRRVVLVLFMSICLIVVIPSIFISITHVMSVALSNVALNTTLNELSFAFVGVRFLTDEELLTLAISSADHPYIHSKTEEFTLLGPNSSLYRTTTGFKGPLAFNIMVDPQNPPNVLVLMIESFRARDSLYLSGETSAGALLKQHNVSITSEFDRWAKRGIAFNNTWSSWQTSRSLESMNYAQLPYDHPAATGTTGGREKVSLAGMPQFFKQRGYDVSFSAGSHINYDGWDTFLPTHGYENIICGPDYEKLAIEKLGLKPEDFTHDRTKNARDMSWGVHDDISFSLLGDILIEKVKAQTGTQTKAPFFMTHYTISSHVTYDAVPQWFEDKVKASGELDKFQVLTKDQKHKAIIDAYHKIRYFTDQQLGLFLDRMEKEGVLQNTILVIAGDHGQGPEEGYSTPQDAQQSTTHVAAAIIAEGHLALKDRGLIMSDAVEQYDFLNTLADIVGVPAGGFQQVGLGRSLKRKVPFGDRLVYSNNPLKKMSIVRGTQRFVYDRVSKAVSMHDVVTDDEMKIDLFPTLSEQEQKVWLKRRDDGRAINTYYKKKMDDECGAEARCT